MRLRNYLGEAKVRLTPKQKQILQRDSLGPSNLGQRVWDSIKDTVKDRVWIRIKGAPEHAACRSMEKKGLGKIVITAPMSHYAFEPTDEALKMAKED